MGFLFALLAMIAAAENEFHSSPYCWEKPRNYHRPFNPEYEKNIGIERVPLQNATAGEYSPNGGYWFELQEPDLSTSPWGPGYLRVYSEQGYLIEVAFSDVKFLHEARWINEKLILVAPWWGRTLGSELILDVEAEEFIWKEMVHGGGNVYNQFKASCPHFEKEPQCQCQEWDGT